MLDEIDFMFEWLKELKIGEKEQVEVPESAEGGLALLDGKLLMKKPSRGGKWPTIVTGPDQCVQVYHRDRLVDKPLVLENTEHIRFELLHRAATSDFRLEISADQMEVWLSTSFVEGIEYKISDSDYVSDLVVTARELRRHAPEPIDYRQILEELDDLGIRIHVDRDLLRAACENGKDERVLIGEGIPPQQPVDGRIEAVQDMSGKRIKRKKNDRIDWFDQGKIESVEPGEVLAYWHPPIMGKPGLNVFGRRIEPRQPKWARFSAGPGAKLVEDGTIAVAEIAGRPTIEWGRICVKPELIVPSDVDITTGNIEFTGDVLVGGNVREALEIKAGGLVNVARNVYHGHIIAGDSVTIGRNLIGGQVTVGGNLVVSTKAATILKRLIPLMRQLHKSTLQLKTHPRFSREDHKLRGDGYLIKLILETRFTAIPNLCDQLVDLLPARDELGDASEIDRIWTILHHIANQFRGVQPLSIKSVSELQSCVAAMEKIIAFLQDVLRTAAHITVGYCQNARLEATGDITATGALVYACRMSAGRNLRIAGSCRGGHYFAGSSITIRHAGLNETVKTHLAVAEGGFVAAETIYPGVEITIGQSRMLIREPRVNIMFRFEGDSWEIKHWRWRL